MRNNPVWIIYLVALASSSSTASASDLSGINIGELGKIQSETILFKAMAERAKAERSITEDESASAAQPSNTGFSGTYAPPQVIQSPPVLSNTTNRQDLPVVQAITGSSQKMRATLLYSGGLEVDATAGREVPGGYRVQQITLDGVTLERKGQRFPLGFSNQAPPLPVVSQDVTPPSAPPAPPGMLPN